MAVVITEARHDSLRYRATNRGDKKENGEPMFVAASEFAKEEVFDYFRGHPEAIGGLHAPLFEDKVVDFIIEMSNISETVVTVEELFQNPDAPVSDKPSSPSEGKGKRSKNVTKGVPKKKGPVKAAKKKQKKSSS